MTLKNALDAVKHSLEQHTRFIRDPLAPPSDAELARRHVEDAWHGIVRPSLNGKNKHHIDWMEDIDDFFAMKKGSYTTEDLTKHTDAIKSKSDDSLNHKKVIGFLESATNLLTSFERSIEGGIEKAWSSFCNAVSSFSSSKKVEQSKDQRTR